MDTNSSPTEPANGGLDDQLVAYLDDELSAGERRQIDLRLVGDAACRQRLDELDRAWEALDALPQTVADEQFTRSTIEMVTLAAAQDLSEQTAQLPAIHRKRLWLAVAVAVASAAAGFAAVGTFVPGEDDVLLADLPVIAQADILTQVEDVEFLRKLTELPLCSLDQDQQALTDELDQLQSIGQTRRQRADWVEDLSTERKAELASQRERFASRPQQQQVLRDLANEIAQAPNATELQRTMLAYAQWLNGRTEGEKAELRSLSTDERLDRIRHMLRKEDRQATKTLSDADRTALRDEIWQIIDERSDSIRARMRRRRGPRAPASRPEALIRWIAIRQVLYELEDEDTRQEIYERLTHPLSAQVQQHLDSLRRRHHRYRQLSSWVVDVVGRQSEPDEEELEEFFENKLDNDQRARLLGLSSIEMKEELKRLYAGDQLGLPEGEWFRDFRDYGRRYDRDRSRRDRPPRSQDDGPQGRRRPDGPPPDGPPPDGRHGRFDRRRDYDHDVPPPRPRPDRGPPPFPPPE